MYCASAQKFLFRKGKGVAVLTPQRYIDFCTPAGTNVHKHYLILSFKVYSASQTKERKGIICLSVSHSTNYTVKQMLQSFSSITCDDQFLDEDQIQVRIK
jgi:hypothetical protein